MGKCNLFLGRGAVIDSMIGRALKFWWESKNPESTSVGIASSLKEDSILVEDCASVGGEQSLIAGIAENAYADECRVLQGWEDVGLIDRGWKIGKWELSLMRGLNS